MKKITLLLLAVVCALFSYAQTAATSNTLGTTGITAINSTTNAAFKLSINGTQKNYGTGDGTGAAATMVISPTIFLQNTTATTGKMYSINANNTGFFRISDAVGTTSFTATDRFVIAPTTGFIGMGNSAPTARLHITSSGITSATNALLVNNSANTNLLTIRDDGNVGIGVAAPAQKLDVAGNINFTGALMANNNAGTAGLFLKSNGAGVAPSWVAATGATTIGTTSIALGGSSLTLAGLSAVTSTSFTGALTGNASTATTATTATNIAGGAVNSIPYQTASGATAMLASTGASGYVLTSDAVGAPTWALPTPSTNTAWGLSGNANATSASFLGTSLGTDIDLVFMRNGISAGRIASPLSSANTSFGLNANPNNTGTKNTTIGLGALQNNTTGISNIAIGVSSLQNNTTGSNNTSIGVQSLQNNTTGIWNSGFAVNTLAKNTTGNYNTASGVNALVFNTTGSSNSAIGQGALQNNTFGNNNTASGVYALLGNTIGEYNTAIGYYSNVGANNLTNATAIGAQAYVSQSNSLILGSVAGVNSALASTNVGIGTSTPAAQLHTTGTVKFAGLVANTNPVRIVVSDVDGNIAYKDAVTFGNTADGSETKVISGSSNVTVSGVGTTLSPYSIAVTTPVSLWDISSLGTNNIINNNIGGVIIGSSITTLSSGYKLYVQDGILTEKLKIRLRTNWPDYVFENDYPLKPLSEIENFIKLNKHLPGIPSAKEVKQEGIEVGETNALLLKKIEELTLYLITADKEIKALQKKVNELDKKN